MSEKSPLDFFSSSRKRSSAKNAASKDKTSAQPQKIKKTIKPKHDSKVNEALEILKNIQEMTQDLERQIQNFAKLTGKTPEAIEAFVDASVAISPKDKAEINQMKAELGQKIKDAAQGVSSGPPAPPGVKTSKKKGKPTGDLRTKNRSAKRKWMSIE